MTRLATLRAALGFLQLSPRAPERELLHRWLDTWAGGGLIETGAALHGYALYLCRRGALHLLNCLVGLLTLVLVSAVTGCASLGQPAAAEKVSVRDLLVTPAWFDGRLVAVSGQVTAARLEISGGGPTHSFRLDDGTQVIDVRAMGGPIVCQPTQRVAVEGWFRAAPLGTGFGSIEAIRVVCQ